LAGDYFVKSRRSVKTRLAFGHSVSIPEKARAKPLRRKEECEGDDGDEERIVEIQTKETAGHKPFSLREKVP
jgi:hypothetical protein